MTKAEKAKRLRFVGAVTKYLNNKPEYVDNPITFKRVSHSIVPKLVTFENRLLVCSERVCNSENYDETYYNELKEQTLKYIDKKIGCKAYINDDPRGAQIRLCLKVPETNNFYNLMDGETSGIVW